MVGVTGNDAKTGPGPRAATVGPPGNLEGPDTADRESVSNSGDILRSYLPGVVVAVWRGFDVK